MPSHLYFVTEKERGYVSDDQYLIRALAKHGLQPIELPWGADVAHLRTDDVLVVRAIWDYHLRTDDFFQWLDAVERTGCRVMNPIALLRWNSRKTYLQELAYRGIRIPQTFFYASASEFRVNDLSAETEFVLKPVISASAYKTVKGNRETISRVLHSGEYQDFLIQEYVPAIKVGEWSLIYIAGELTHAVKKVPKVGDFRVQKELGGKVMAFPAPEGLERTAQEVLQALPEAPVYARIDLVATAEDVYLMEVELIEPQLFLEFSEHAAERFAAQIANTAKEPSVAI